MTRKSGSPIGGRSLSELVDNTQNDRQADFFIDLTTKLYFGRVTREAYASSIAAFFPRGSNQSGLECVFSQLRTPGGAK